MDETLEFLTRERNRLVNQVNDAIAALRLIATHTPDVEAKRIAESAITKLEQ